MSFPGGSIDKESACNARDPGSIPGSGRLGQFGHCFDWQCLLKFAASLHEPC